MLGNMSGQECTFSYMYTCIGYKLPTFGEYMLVGEYVWPGTCPYGNLSVGNLSGGGVVHPGSCLFATFLGGSCPEYCPEYVQRLTVRGDNCKILQLSAPKL